MSNIGNYSNAGNTVNPTSYAKLSNTTEKIEKFAEYLHEFRPVLEKEFDDLEKLSASHSNAIFPIKMQALADIYKAAEPLYEWYVVKKKNRV